MTALTRKRPWPGFWRNCAGNSCEPGETLVINLKSMIGLLSQSAGNGQQSLQVVCDGTDEEEALVGVLEELRR